MRDFLNIYSFTDNSQILSLNWNSGVAHKVFVKQSHSFNFNPSWLHNIVFLPDFWEVIGHKIVELSVLQMKVSSYNFISSGKGSCLIDPIVSMTLHAA